MFSGTIPGPVLTGVVIDSACALWQDLCGSRGSCWFYDRFEMSWRLFLWWTAVKISSASLFLLSIKFYKPQDTDTTHSTRIDVTVFTTDVEHSENNQNITANGSLRQLQESQL